MDPMTMMMAMQMLGGAGGASGGAPEHGNAAISKFMLGANKGGKEGGLPKADFSSNAFSSFNPQAPQFINPALKQLGGF